MASGTQIYFVTRKKWTCRVALGAPNQSDGFQESLPEENPVHWGPLSFSLGARDEMKQPRDVKIGDLQFTAEGSDELAPPSGMMRIHVLTLGADQFCIWAETSPDQFREAQQKNFWGWTLRSELSFWAHVCVRERYIYIYIYIYINIYIYIYIYM